MLPSYHELTIYLLHSSSVMEPNYELKQSLFPLVCLSQVFCNNNGKAGQPQSTHVPQWSITYRIKTQVGGAS